MQNKWSKKTLEIVNNEDYLDRLQQIYSHEEAERDVSEQVLQQIRDSFGRGDKTSLLNQLLEFKRFDSVEGAIKNTMAKNILTIAGLHESIVDESDQDTDILIYRDGKIKNWKPLLDDLVIEKWSKVELIEIV